MASPYEGKQGRHPKDCLCLKHMAQRGVQPVVQPIATPEVSPMTQSNDLMAMLQTLLAQQNGTPAPAPITQAQAPVVVATPAITPTEYIEIPCEALTEKANGFSTTKDSRGLPKTFNLNTDDVRITTLYLNPAWLNGRKNVTVRITAS